MRLLSALGLTAALLVPPAGLGAQDASAALATVHLADGTSVALLDWRLSYQYGIWRKKDRISNARSETRESAALILGNKSYPVKGETLSVTHAPKGNGFRVASMTLKTAGGLKVEGPDKDALAPDLSKDFNYQPQTLDLLGKTLSGMDRSFCVVSFWDLIDCGTTDTTRVVRIEFN